MVKKKTVEDSVKEALKKMREHAKSKKMEKFDADSKGNTKGRNKRGPKPSK